MSMIAKVPEPNIWDEICKEFAVKRPPFREDDEQSVHTTLEDFDPAKVSPVFYGQMYVKIKTDEEPISDFDPAKSHPACVGYAFVDRPPPSPIPTPQEAPPKDKCSAKEYLEHYIFPVLLPALEEMLRQAQKERCFERKRTKFNALDFLTEYLYKNNPQHQDRSKLTLWDIPFVRAWLEDHPRPPLPLSLIWSEEEAALVIQSFWRGFLVRREPEVSELRQWQREWKEENENITNKVSDFWAKKMPDGDKATPHASTEQLASREQASDVIIKVDGQET